MRLAFWIISLLFACGSGTHEKTVIAITSSDKIVDTLHSKILNEHRYIWIQLPATSTNTTKKYPVVCLLDAEANFDATINIVKKLSAGSPGKAGDEVIIVGIGNIWSRYRDYSPSQIRSSAWVDEPTAKTTGGGLAFISFIENELLPYIEKKYPVSSDRTLIGHSMGGLMVMEIFLKHELLFNNYIAIDPSMWWDDNKLLNESAAILPGHVYKNSKLFVAIANEQEKRMSMEQLKKDTSLKTAQIRPSFSLVDLIEKNKPNGLRFEWKFYKDEHHMTVNSPATYDALKTILN